MTATDEDLTEYIVIRLTSSELAIIRQAAASVKLSNSEYVRMNALGLLPSSFDALAHDLTDAAARAHSSVDAALAQVAASETRIKASEGQAD